MARVDPLWAVLTDPAMKGGGWELDEFLATGERELGEALETAAALGLPERWGRALDVGCGVGRVSRALARRFDSCLGVDGSETMVAHARRIAGDADGCEFRVLDATGLDVLPAASFDLVWSLLVLQHLPRPGVEAAIGSLVTLLAEGGLAVFQPPHSTTPVHRLQVSRRLYRTARAAGVSADVLHRRTPLTPMRMTALSEERVREVVEAAGGRVLATVPYGPQDDPTPSLQYFAARGLSRAPSVYGSMRSSRRQAAARGRRRHA